MNVNVFDVGGATFTLNWMKKTISWQVTINKDLFNQQTKHPCFSNELISLTFTGDSGIKINIGGFIDCECLISVTKTKA